MKSGYLRQSLTHLTRSFRNSGTATPRNGARFWDVFRAAPSSLLR